MAARRWGTDSGVWDTDTGRAYFPAVLTPLTLPPRLLLRALDDLHALAEAARTLPAVEERLARRIEALEERAEDVLDLGERLDARAGAFLELGGDLRKVAGEVVERADRVVAALPAVEAMGQSATKLAAAAEPLQGAAERLTRLVDRFPGGGFFR